jgi:hypothetical protein
VNRGGRMGRRPRLVNGKSEQRRERDSRRCCLSDDLRATFAGRSASANLFSSRRRRGGRHRGRGGGSSGSLCMGATRSAGQNQRKNSVGQARTQHPKQRITTIARCLSTTQIP